MPVFRLQKFDRCTYFAPLGTAKWSRCNFLIIGQCNGCFIIFIRCYWRKTPKSAMETVKDSFGIHGQLFAILNVLQLAGWTAIMIYDGAIGCTGNFPGWSVDLVSLIGVLIIVRS